MKKEKTRLLLLNAAKNIVHTDGHEEVTVRRIAELTGYSYPILYHYFKDINSLLWTLRLVMIEDMIVELSKPKSLIIEPLDDLKQTFRLYIRYFFNHSNVFRFFYFYPFKKPTDNHEYDTLELRFQTMWQESFTRLVDSEYIKAVEIETIAKTIIYSIQGMIMMSFSSNGSLTESKIYDEVDTIINYLIKKGDCYESN